MTLLLTLATIYLTIVGLVDPKDFMAIVGLAFWYFFWSRGKEETSQQDKTISN